MSIFQKYEDQKETEKKINEIETLTHVFSCGICKWIFPVKIFPVNICEIFKNIFFTEDFQCLLLIQYEKLLGVMFDNKLTFAEYIKIIWRKTKSKLNAPSWVGSFINLEKPMALTQWTHLRRFGIDLTSKFHVESPCLACYVKSLNFLFGNRGKDKHNLCGRKRRRWNWNNFF